MDRQHKRKPKPIMESVTKGNVKEISPLGRQASPPPIPTLYNLVTVRTYAKKMDVTTQQVYNWINSGKVKERVIDGVKFIIEP